MVSAMNRKINYVISLQTIIVMFLSTSMTAQLTRQQIDDYIYSVEHTEILEMQEYNLNKIIDHDLHGGGIIKLWTDQWGKPVKILTEAYFSWGVSGAMVYLMEDAVVFVEETENHFRTGEGIDAIEYSDDIFHQIVYIYDMDMEDGEYITDGKRTMTEGHCSLTELDYYRELAKKALAHKE